MTVRGTPPELAQNASRLRRGRLLSALVVVAALLFSPTVTPLLGRLWQASPAPLALPALRVPVSSNAGVQRYAQSAQPFQQALDELQVGERRRVTLSEAHFQLFLRASPLLGQARTDVMLEMLSSEIRNQNPGRGRRSVFSSPEAALDNAQEWLRYLAWA